MPRILKRSRTPIPEGSSHCRYYGMLDIDLEVIKAFAFAQGEGWHKYTVSFLVLSRYLMSV